MDSVIYGTLISVCASCKQCKEAENYFNQMKSEGHVPNDFHYSSLLNAYSVDGNYEKAEEIYKEMKLAGLVSNKVCFVCFGSFKVHGIIVKVWGCLYVRFESDYVILNIRNKKISCY